MTSTMGGISGLDLVPFVLEKTPENGGGNVSGQHNMITASWRMRGRRLRLHYETV